MTNFENNIIYILQGRVGAENAITQKELAYKLRIAPRTVRAFISHLVDKGYPIVSSTSQNGGYFWQGQGEEGLKYSERMRRFAIKMWIKAKNIKANCRVGQGQLKIR